MNTVINVHLAKAFSAAARLPAKVLLILDNKDMLNSLALSSQLCKTLALSTQMEVNLLQKVASKLSPTTDFSSSVDCTFLDGEGNLRQFVVSALSTTYSRHNSPSRSHSISAAVTKLSAGTEDAMIVVVPKSTDHVFAQVCAVGRCFPLYNVKTKSTSAPEPTPNTISLVIAQDFIDVDENSAEGKRLVSDCNITINNIRLTQRLVDTPPNELNTKTYAEECEALAIHLGCSIKIIKGEDLQRQGFGGLWGVGKASDNLPALVILSHCPANVDPSAESICFVGKGIVYDTGGLSIKVSPNMAGMKCDMGGSAGILGAFATAVQSGCMQKSSLHALLCLAENAVGPLATRPDDIHTMLSGKTVEINNTDAEGRLVLADGVHYASKFLNPKVIIDMATLTGAQLIATGKGHGALYCNDENLEQVLVAAGKSSGDLTHPLPYCPEFYRNEFRSKVADMRNSVWDRGNAQSSCAGQFIGNHLESYLEKGGAWCHIDMAGPVMNDGRATGYGVALLYKALSTLD